jgi:hypothetical protein
MDDLRTDISYCGPVILRNKEYRLLGYKASPFSVPTLYTVYFPKSR